MLRGRFEGSLARTFDKGRLDSTGGYLVVKEDGEILCYRIKNRNEFDEYLLLDTEIIDPCSTRMKFGKIYEENGIEYFKLNLQIRIIK